MNRSKNGVGFNTDPYSTKRGVSGRTRWS